MDVLISSHLLLYRTYTCRMAGAGPGHRTRRLQFSGGVGAQGEALAGHKLLLATRRPVTRDRPNGTGPSDRDQGCRALTRPNGTGMNWYLFSCKHLHVSCTKHQQTWFRPSGKWYLDPGLAGFWFAEHEVNTCQHDKNVTFE